MLYPINATTILLDLRGDARPKPEIEKHIKEVANEHFYQTRTSADLAGKTLQVYHMRAFDHGIWIVSKFRLVPMQTRPVAVHHIRLHPLPPA